MENENKNIGFIQNESNENIFKPSFDNQNLSDNPDFQNWNSLMMKKYGDKGKLYKCPNDKIYFYTSDEESGRFHENDGFCPLCKQSICFFCNRFTPHTIANCCMKRKLKEMLMSGKEGLEAKMDDLDFFGRAALFYFLLPGMNLIFFIGIIFNFSYYKYAMSNGEPYECFLHNNYTRFSIIVAINGITSMFLSFSFFLHGFYISILLLISLLTTKKILFFVIGFFYRDWMYIYKNYKKVFHISG